MEDETYHDVISLNKAVNKVQKNVFGVLRVALDSHDVISIPEHLNSSLVRPSNHLYLRWELSYLIS